MPTERKLAIILLISVMFFSTNSLADVEKGQKIYLKTLYLSCGMSGAGFARQHSQNEWEQFYEAGKFEAEVTRLCPRAKIDQKNVSDIYDFVYYYAKGSGKVPNS